jgi:hypothetical protein
MHLLYYGRDVLHLHALNEPFTVILLVGAAYGATRLVIDLLNALSRIGGGRSKPAPVWERPPPPPPPS